MGKKQSKAKRSSAMMNLAPSRNGEMLRKYRKTILLNEKELSTINQYCAKYKIKSKSAFIRNAVIAHILEQMDENYPKLF